MEIAKMTSKGQLTVPKAVREELELEAGKKVLFVKRGDDWVMLNPGQPSRQAENPNTPDGRKALLRGMVREVVPEYQANRILKESVDAQTRETSPLEILGDLQKGFEGVAETSGWKTEQDVVDYIKKLRRGESK